MSKTEVTLCQARALRKGNEILVDGEWQEIYAVHTVEDITFVYFTRDSKIILPSDKLVRVDR